MTRETLPLLLRCARKGVSDLASAHMAGCCQAAAPALLLPRSRKGASCPTRRGGAGFCQAAPAGSRWRAPRRGRRCPGEQSELLCQFAGNNADDHAFRTAWKDNCKLEDHCKDRRQELYDNWWYWARDFIWLELEQVLARRNVASPIWKLKFVRARTLL